MVPQVPLVFGNAFLITRMLVCIAGVFTLRRQYCKMSCRALTYSGRDEPGCC